MQVASASCPAIQADTLAASRPRVAATTRKRLLPEREKKGRFAMSKAEFVPRNSYHAQGTYPLEQEVNQLLLKLQTWIDRFQYLSREAAGWPQMQGYN